MLRSLSSGVSGLRAQQTALDVIGNNLANMNTIGFRSARITFADLLNQTITGAVGAKGDRGGINAVQVGLGVKTNSIDTITNPGQLQITNRLMDLSIQGSGFFTLSDGMGGTYYTRAGAFGFDEAGYVTNPGNGYRLIGLNADNQGVLDPTLPPHQIQIDFNSIAEAQVTNNITYGGNLDSGTEAAGAQRSNRFLTTFTEFGNPLEVVAGDTLRITNLFYDDITTPGPDPHMTEMDVMVLTNDTTVEDVADALKLALRQMTGSTTIDVGFQNGQFTFDCANETIGDMQITAFSVAGEERLEVRQLFTEPPSQLTTGYLDGDIDIPPNTQTRTRVLRQADGTSSIDTYDSQGNPRTVVTTWAKNTENVRAIQASNLAQIQDLDKNNLGLAAGDLITFEFGQFVDDQGNPLVGDMTNQAAFVVGAGSTMQDIIAWIQNSLQAETGQADITVRLLDNGRLEVESGTVGIQNLILGYDAGGAGAPATDGPLSRLFNNYASGLPDMTPGAEQGLTVMAGATTQTNAFYLPGTLNNTFHYQVMVPNDLRFPPSNTYGELVFNPNGTFHSYGFDEDGIPIRNNPLIEFDPDGTDPRLNGVDSLTISLNMQNISQTASSTSAASISQDGSAVGQLESVSITEDGVLRGIFSNGTTRTMAQLMISTFANEGGLFRRGDTLFLESPNSGEPNIGIPMTGARGKIISGSLEMSNVDVAEQFTQMIMAQRAFQANARTITTSDEILLEVVNLKR